MYREYKQIIVVRSDLKLSKGKMAVQVAHASVEAYRKSGTEARKLWEKEGSKKVVVKVDSLNELLKIKEKVKNSGFPYSLIKDAGRTEIPPGTVTALGIGPCETKKIDMITKNLKMV